MLVLRENRDIVVKSGAKWSLVGNMEGIPLLAD